MKKKQRDEARCDVERKNICQFVCQIYAEKQRRCILLFIYFAGGLINSPDLLTVLWPQDVWSEMNERTTGKSSGGGVVFGFFLGGELI